MKSRKSIFSLLLMIAFIFVFIYTKDNEIVRDVLSSLLMVLGYMLCRGDSGRYARKFRFVIFAYLFVIIMKYLLIFLEFLLA